MSSIPLKRPVVVKDLHTGLTIPYSDIKDAAQELDITVRNLYRRIADGKPFKVGRFVIADYEKFYKSILEELERTLTNEDALSKIRWALGL